MAVGAIQLQNPGAWVTTGNPATVNDASPVFAPGQVGTYTVTADSIAIPSAANAIPPGAFPRVFQYVQLSAASATPAYGQLVVWLDSINQTVTTVNSTTKRNQVAGVVLNASATLGNFIWIGVSGIFPILVENGQTPAVGDAVIGGATTAGRFGITAQGTAPLAQQLGVILGTKTTAFNGSSALPTDVCAAQLYIPRPGAL
jgi:hypothetical protein